jgi:hypothetical protein
MMFRRTPVGLEKEYPVAEQQQNGSWRDWWASLLAHTAILDVLNIVFIALALVVMLTQGLYLEVATFCLILVFMLRRME